MRSALILLAGALMILSSLAHAFLGWPAMRSALEEVGAGGDLAAGLAVGWYFGSAAMAAFGVVVLLAGRRLRRGDRSGMAPVLIIAACYLAFGIAAFLARGLNPHFLLFVFTGLLAGVPALGPARDATRPSRRGRA